MKMRPRVALAPMTWFETGGCAAVFCEPTTDRDFRKAAAFAHARKRPVFVLGEGANVLVSDEGFDGLVIRPRNAEVAIIRRAAAKGCVRVCAGAGATIDDVIDFCLHHRLLGLEEFSGIPGTVGGAVFINVHYFEHLLSEFVESARVLELRTGDIASVPAAWFRFGYDESRLQDGEFILVDATFTLRRGTAIEAAYATGRRDEIKRHRERRYPTSHTCGSFFRNFAAHEISQRIAGKKITHIAYYLDKLGVKGTLSVGDAAVSPKHANMIVNQGHATSRDIVRLARKMQVLVKQRFGIVPQPECQLVGFGRNPLLAR